MGKPTKDPVVAPAEDRQGWGPGKRIVFRFVFAHFVVYLLTLLLGLFSAFVNVFVDRLPFLSGAEKVDEFEVDGNTRPYLITGAERWKRVVFDNPEMVAIQLMSDTLRRYTLKLDAASKSLDLTKQDEPESRIPLDQ
jgi:hypothetical protein